MVTLARSTAWRDVDRRYVSAVNTKPHADGVVARAAKSRWRRLLLDPALLGLGASMTLSCVEQQPPPPQVTATIQPPQQPAPKMPSLVVPRPVRKPSPPQATENPPAEGPSPKADEGALAMIPPEPARPVPSPAVASPPQSAVAPPPQVKELIGLDQPAATHLFGAAVERAEEPPASVWRYKTATCELDLFFYLDLRTGRMRTLHYTFKGDAADSTARQNCLRDLAAARGS
jgi:outer membrane biosynthesis protein TonB